MIRIRPGAAWRHDPSLRDALRRGSGPERLAAARRAVDALALEVDGVDLAAGLAEGPLLATLEALLRAIARVVAGASHATVTFPDGELELLIRRRGGAALLSVVALSRPSRVLARDVEVELEALAAAALDASADVCREVAELLAAEDARETRPLRAAARALRRTEARSGVGPGLTSPARTPRVADRSAPVACLIELGDDDGLLAAYEGGRADLGSLLGPGRVLLRAADGTVVAAVAGAPFLAARDLGTAADALLGAVRAREPRCTLPLAHPRSAPAVLLEVDLAAGRVRGPGGDAPCPPLALARAFAEAQLELGRTARARNPRQAENPYVAELERGAAGRLAQIAELAEGDRAGAATAHVPAPARVPQRPLGPGRLRRLAFRETFRVEVGPPARDGLVRAGAVAIAAGAARIAAIAPGGETRWTAEGCAFAALAGGALVAASGGTLRALSPRSGRPLWARPLPGMTPVAAVSTARGPIAVVERDAVTAVDAGSGRTLWRFEPPGASRVHAAPFGGLLVVGTDAGLIYGLDAAGRLAWRLAAPGPVLRPPSAAAGACLVLCDADAGAALLAIDPAGGARRWEALVDASAGAALVPWGGGVAVTGTEAGDPIVSALSRDGAAAWSVAPPLAGAIAATAAGPLLVVRDAAGALAALGRDGAVRWSRPAPADAGPSRAAPPAVVRGTVLAAAGDALQAVDARTGELVGAIPSPAPLRLLADASLSVVTLDGEGVATGWRLATHLSVV
jgi:outer membrane protein assembly factor BamB